MPDQFGRLQKGETSSTVINKPSPTIEAWQRAVSPQLIDQATKTPEVYGRTFIPLKITDADGNEIDNPDPNAGRYVSNDDPSAAPYKTKDDQPLTAGTNADIETAKAQVRAGQGAGQFGLVRGGANIANAAGMDIYGAGAPAYGQAGQYYDQAAAGKSGLAGQGQFNAATGMFEQAANTDTASMYSPYAQQAQGQYGQAGNLYGQSTDALGLSSASPYLQAAGLSSAQNVGQYMNPYNEQVTNRIAQLGARNLSENILPSISSDFIKAGGYGSTRQRDLVGRAARDTQDSILAQQSQALQQGYGQGLTASAADLARYGNLAGTAGSLGTQQQQILQGAGAGLGNLGTSYSNLGSTYAGLAGSDAARRLQAGQGMFGIGQANIQASQADLARMLAAGQGQAGIGAGLGSLMTANQQGQLAAGKANIDLGKDAQSMTLRDSGALMAVGEDTEDRANALIEAKKGAIDTSNNAIINRIGATGNAITSGGQGGGTTSSNTVTNNSGSTAGKVAGAAGTAAAIYGMTKAKGGAIKKGSLKKSSYGKLPKRGLSMFARAS
jgi:hypothetical protein